MAVLGLSGYSYSLVTQKKAEIDIVRQSRPESMLSVDRENREITQHLAVNNDDVSFWHSVLNKHAVSLNSFKVCHPDMCPEVVYIDLHPTYVSYQPYLVQGFKLGDFDTLSKFAANKNGHVLLAGGNLGDRIVTAHHIYQTTGFIVAVLLEDDPIKAIGVDDDIPLTEANEPLGDIFNYNLFDLRSAENVRQTQTVFNAKIATNLDFSLLPNWKLRALFSKKGAVFSSYYPTSYPSVNAALKLAKVIDYRFYRGGLERFFDRGGNLTPNYLNERLLSPDKIMTMEMQSNQLRFICLDSRLCLDNIPRKQLIVIPTERLTRTNFRERVRALPNEFQYVALSSNQETAGAALIAGYELANSGHTYLGELAMYERFSIEEIRHKIGESYTYNTSIEAYRQTHHQYLDMVDLLRGLVAKFGWVPIFAIMGLVLRLLCFPVQSLVYKSYYFENNTNPYWLLTALLVPVFIVLAYMQLSDLLTYYGVVPFPVQNAMLSVDQFGYIAYLVILICGQALISFPRNLKLGMSICFIVCLGWGLGLFDGIPLPLTCFLIASELTAFVTQLPYALKYFFNCWYQKQGFATAILLGSDWTYPDKWKNLALMGKRSSILVRTDAGVNTVEAVFNRFARNRELFVRSASADKKEQALGGYFNSHKVRTLSAFQTALAELKLNGCEFAFLEYYECCEITGVASSLSLNGEGVYVAWGKPEAATEGSSGVSTYVQSRKPSRWFRRDNVTRLLRQCELAFAGGVIIEWGKSPATGQIQLFQVRNVSNSGVNKLYPDDLSSWELAESFLARCTPVTGNFIESISAGNYVYIDGYLYNKRKMGNAASIWRTIKLQSLITSVIESVSQSISDTNTSPASYVNNLQQAIDLYAQLFKACISPHRAKLTMPVQWYVNSRDGSELEIAGEKHLELYEDGRQFHDRELLHACVCLCSYLVNFYLCRLMNTKTVDHQTNHQYVLSGVGERQLSAKVQGPLGTIDHCRTFVSGRIYGKPYFTSQGFPIRHRGEEEVPWILVGEEISSDWVKHLTDFNGVLSVYGHEQSHLALSVSALNIPYTKITGEQLAAIDASKILDFDTNCSNGIEYE